MQDAIKQHAAGMQPGNSGAAELYAVSQPKSPTYQQPAAGGDQRLLIASMRAHASARRPEQAHTLAAVLGSATAMTSGATYLPARPVLSGKTSAKLGPNLNIQILAGCITAHQVMFSSKNSDQCGQCACERGEKACGALTGGCRTWSVALSR